MTKTNTFHMKNLKDLRLYMMFKGLKIRKSSFKYIQYTV